MTAVVSGYSVHDVRQAFPADARVDALEARGHTVGLADERANHVHEVHAVFQQHAALRFRLERLGRFPGVVLREVEEAWTAEEPRAVSFQDVAKPGPIGMVLMNGKETLVVSQLGHERPRVLQPVAERLLTDDVHPGPRGPQAVLAMQPGRREDIDEIEGCSTLVVVGKEGVQRFVKTCAGCELCAALVGAFSAGSTSATISTSGIRCQPRRWNSEIMPQPTIAPRSFIHQSLHVESAPPR